MRTIRHSEQTLRTALISKTPELVAQYESFDAGELRLMNEAFQPNSVLFEPITLHSESDWMTSHPEVPQDFEQFFNDPKRKIPSPEKCSIYIQSIGSLGNTRLISDEYIKWLKGYCEAFFYGLTVKLLEPIPVSATRCSFRVTENTQNLQIHAGVGIFSFARYSDAFYSECHKGKGQKLVVSSSSDYSVFDNYCVPEITGVLLLRSCKTLTHEIGHIFGMRHCQWLSCLMQGSNHLEEADRRPPHLCPICLRKLQSAIGFHIADRYHALLRWIEEEPADVPGRTPKPAREEAANWPERMAVFKEWKEWIVKCLAVLQK
ncbi:archaemetzincin-2 isoform X2 [Tenrec ecaudatus]|uniref:archaemetzincin-2 isoform X2 n=1 Tax=Tenrec ecaudatus TaxID=94439 RepID=UPI003F5ADD30